MQRLVRAQGGELVVLFIPSKAQVYLPLLEASFPSAGAASAPFASALAANRPPELDVV